MIIDKSIDDNDQVIATVSDNLTDWANEPTVAMLKQDYIDAKPTHDRQVSKIRTWLDNLNITGAAQFKKIQGKSSIVPKLIRKQAEWRYASLTEPVLSTDDIYNGFPRTAEDKQAAEQNVLILNHQFNTQIRKVDFIDELGRAIVDEGTGIVRVGWDFEEIQQDVEVPIIELQPTNDPAVEQQYQQIMQAAQQDPNILQQVSPHVVAAMEESVKQGQMLVPVQTGTRTETQTITVKNQPTVEVCDYNNIIVDPTAQGNIDKANFVIYAFQTSLAELKQDGDKYYNLDKIVPSNSSAITEPDFEDHNIESFTFTDKPRQKFVAYEYWGFRDIHNDGTVKPFVATYVNNTMIRLEENPFPDGKVPFVFIQYLPVRKSMYGEPDGVLLEDNQKVIGAVTRGMIDTLGRSANGQMATRKDALDVTNKRKMMRGLDYEFNSQVDPRQAFHMHTYPEIPQSAQIMLQMQHADAESLTGIKAFSNGITGTSLGDTATGINRAVDATAKRELGILRRLAEGIKEIGYKFVAMNGEFLSEEETIRKTNDEFIKIRRDDLSGNFDLRLEISTPESDSSKAKELAFMLQTMGNNMDPAMSRIILSDIAKLNKMPTLSKSIANFQPQPDPLAQKKAELEIALIEAEIAKTKSMAIENEANAKLDLARVEAELAKARKLGSESDLKDLDFVEQESGVDRQQKLDEIEQKRNTDLDLKAADAALADVAEQPATGLENL